MRNPSLVSLRTLMSSVPIPREGEDNDEMLVTVAPTLPPQESSVPPHWSTLLVTLNKLQGEGMK